jgi:hypothetical protein
MMTNPKDHKTNDRQTTTPPDMDFEPVPLPDKPPQTGTAAGKTRGDKPGTGEKTEDQT